MRLGQELGDAEALIRALDGLFGTAFNSARFLDAEWASDQLIDIGRKGGSLKALVLGLQFKGMSLFCGGCIPACSQLPGTVAGTRGKRGFGGQRFSEHGDALSVVDVSHARLLSACARTIRQGRGHHSPATAYRRAACLGNGCVLLALQGGLYKIAEFTTELLPLAEANGLNLWLNMASFFFGWATVNSSHDLSGLERMQKVCD